MSNKKETIEQIVDLLRSLVEEEDTQENPKPVTKKKKTAKKTANKKTTRRKTPTAKVDDKESTNKFLSMPEMHMFKDDTLIDKKLQVSDPCPRTRSFNTISVTCRMCGKSEQVNPVLVSEKTRYKCNVCASSGG